jgi:hypothetical protein
MTTPTRNFLIATGVVAVVLLLMLLTNPTENGFRTYLQEYIQTQSGETLAPKEMILLPAFQRSNYHLFSTYITTLEGVEHEYLGVFGSFHAY